jgi:hypothetical protein
VESYSPHPERIRKEELKMKLRQLLRSKLLPVTAGAVVVALAAGGVAYASTPSTTAPVSTGTSAASGSVKHPVLRHDVVWLVRHTVHAQLIVHTKSGYQTIEIDKGKLVSDSATTITIVRPDGPTVSATVTSSTKFYGLKESQLAPGDGVALVQGAGKAIFVASRTPRSTSSSGG